MFKKEMPQLRLSIGMMMLAGLGACATAEPPKNC
jgi:hypothetical protein